MSKIKGELELVDIDLVVPNTWNPNEMDEKMFAKELTAIKRFGFVRAIVTREQGGLHEIIDGFHRFLAVKELGTATIPVRNLGPVSTAKAKQLTIVLNGIKGQPDYVKLADLFASVKTLTVADIAELLPYSASEIENFIGASKYEAEEYDFGDYKGDSAPDEVTLTLAAKVLKDDAEFILQKSEKLCTALGYSGMDKRARLGKLFLHLAQKAVQ